MKGDKPGRAVVFDMDGTLFDTEVYYFEALREALLRQGGSLDQEEYFSELAGTTNWHAENVLSERFPGELDLERFRSDWTARWSDLIESRGLDPAPGIEALLASLCEGGVPVAIASSADRVDIDHCLKAGGLAEYFQVIASGDEVSRSKPDPEIFLLAAERLGCDPRSCVAVEDSTHGAQAAMRAGMQVVVVPGRAGHGAVATRRASMAEEVGAIVLELLEG